MAPLRALAALAAGVGLLALLAANAGAAKVELDHMVLRADGVFKPQSLPRHRYAPVRFQGFADIRSKTGGAPPALRRVRLHFDNDGRLSVAGLPVCRPAQVRIATPKQARRRCRGAIVGVGRIAAAVSLPLGLTAKISSPLTLFNGPRQGRNPTVLAHARATLPLLETYAITIPIERTRGRYGYRATLKLPPLAGGLGALTHIEARIGRIYRFRGAKRSYTYARCSDGVLETRGRFLFDDGTVIDGNVFKFCNVRRR